jgi:hypothetical protein
MNSFSSIESKVLRCHQYKALEPFQHQAFQQNLVAKSKLRPDSFAGASNNRPLLQPVKVIGKAYSRNYFDRKSITGQIFYCLQDLANFLRYRQEDIHDSYTAEKNEYKMYKKGQYEDILKKANVAYEPLPLDQLPKEMRALDLPQTYKLRFSKQNWHQDYTAHLKKQGLDVNVQDGNGDTLLHKQILKIYNEMDRHDIQEKLLLRGADLNIKNQHGLTPFHIYALNLKKIGGFSQWQEDNLKKYFKESDQSKVSTYLDVQKQCTFLRTLIRAGADPTLKTPCGENFRAIIEKQFADLPWTRKQILQALESHTFKSKYEGPVGLIPSKELSHE